MGGAAARASATHWAIWTALTCLAALTGCFDAERLTKARRDIANGYMLVEVDLGEYHVPLPTLPNMPGGGVIDFHAFAQVANREKKSVQEQLAPREPELRHRILLAVRELDQTQIDQPELNSLREAVAAVVNGMLPEEPIQGVGFYRVGFYSL